MLPHPGVKERAFVLYPLHDIFPDMKIFGYDYSENFKTVMAIRLLFIRNYKMIKEH